MAEETYTGGIAKGLTTMIDEGMLDDNALVVHDEQNSKVDYDSLASYIVTEFGINDRAREDSWIEREIMNSLRAYNGNYSPKDLARIKATGGSSIFMNLTATKARAAKSWIADVFRPPGGKPWSIEPTPIEELPEGIAQTVEAALQKEFEELLKPAEGEQPQQKTIQEAQETMREENQKRRDVKTAIADEITTEAQYQLKKMEKKIDDQLVEGDWDSAFLDFLDDFVVYPAAFIKGPIVVATKRLAWVKGEAVEVTGYKMINKRVNPIDMYPAPNAETIDDGNLMEHIRLDKAKIGMLRGVKDYQDEAIIKVLEEAENGIYGSWLDTEIEQEKYEQEKRGTHLVQDGTIHGLHFWGFITLAKLQQWQFFEKLEGITETDPNAVLHVEAILVGNHVIKCVLNDDPLHRRPYYKASFMNVPGSFWGKSLPTSMDAQQRMCNAVSRSLSNNLGVSSGPQVEIYVDRLADQGAITEVTPFKIWQLKSDPTGAGGRAINFWQPTSNADSLLNVYKRFEEMADDVTGIPKYAYGNEKGGGSTQTAQGLAMLLETTSKIIKDCIRNIDEGVLKRRIKYQFHYNMINKVPGFEYTGDINVKTIGSESLSIKGAEATRRNEFLQATANEMDMAVMGPQGRASILREMAGDLGLSESLVPTDYELKAKAKKDAAAAAKAQEAAQAVEMEKSQAGLKATTVQIEGQKEMHVNTMHVEMQKLQQKAKKDQEDIQLAIKELQRKWMDTQNKATGTAAAEQGKTQRQTQEVALKLKTGKPGV